MRSLTRRTMLGGATALPFVAAAPALGKTVGTHLSADRTAWERALAASYAAEQVSLEAVERYERAHSAYAEVMPPEPPLERFFKYGESDIPLSFGSEATLRRPVSYDGSGFDVQYRKLHDEMLQDWDTYAATRAQMRARYRLDELGEACDQAGNAACRAHNRLMTTPAPDAAALAIKLERLWGDTLDWGEPCDEHKRAVVADAKRLAGREASNG